MTELDYDNSILRSQKRITSNLQRIKELEDDIRELQMLQSKMSHLRNAIENSASTGDRKINNIPSFFRHAVKLNLFSGVMNVIKGAEYQKAISGVEKGKKAFQDKIDECYREIEALKQENHSLQTKINTLKEDKKNFLKEQEKNKNE